MGLCFWGTPSKPASGALKKETPVVTRWDLAPCWRAPFRVAFQVANLLPTCGIAVLNHETLFTLSRADFATESQQKQQHPTCCL